MAATNFAFVTYPVLTRRPRVRSITQFDFQRTVKDAASDFPQTRTRLEQTHRRVIHRNQSACSLSNPMGNQHYSPVPLQNIPSQHQVVNLFQDHQVDAINKSSHHSDLSEAVAVVIIPGYGSDAAEYQHMASLLASSLLPRRAVVRVAPVRWHTWLHTVGGRPVTPVLRAVDAAVDQAIADAGVSRVTIVGHSAGGWIGRIWLSRQAAYHGTVWSGAHKARKLICLGTPQTSAEPVTRNNMAFLDEQCPNCAEAPDVEYICLCGTGHKIPENALNDPWWKLRFWESPSWMARVSYEITAGSDGSAVSRIGDGIVPTSVAYLDGATNVALDGVWHSPASAGPWYGHPRAVAYWSQFVH